MLVGFGAEIKLLSVGSLCHAAFVMVLHALGEMQWVWHDEHSVFVFGLEC